MTAGWHEEKPFHFVERCYSGPISYNYNNSLPQKFDMFFYGAVLGDNIF